MKLEQMSLSWIWDIAFVQKYIRNTSLLSKWEATPKNRDQKRPKEAGLEHKDNLATLFYRRTANNKENINRSSKFLF